MTVRSILSVKGVDVTTIEPSRTLADVARQLAERNIGAVVVTGSDRQVRGIVSERDIVRALANRGVEVMTAPVSEVMTTKVVTCAPDDTVNDIMGVMTGGHFRHVPVVEHGKLVGIISIGDVVKHRLGEMERESRALKEYILTA